jgi:hypothetical protein
VAAVLEQRGREKGDDDADQIYVSMCWYYSLPEHAAELDEAFADAQVAGLDALRVEGWDL